MELEAVKQIGVVGGGDRLQPFLALLAGLLRAQPGDQPAAERTLLRRIGRQQRAQHPPRLSLVVVQQRQLAQPGVGLGQFRIEPHGRLQQNANLLHVRGRLFAALIQRVIAREIHQELGRV